MGFAVRFWDFLATTLARGFAAGIGISERSSRLGKIHCEFPLGKLHHEIPAALLSFYHCTSRAGVRTRRVHRRRGHRRGAAHQGRAQGHRRQRRSSRQGVGMMIQAPHVAAAVSACALSVYLSRSNRPPLTRPDIHLSLKWLFEAFWLWHWPVVSILFCPKYCIYCFAYLLNAFGLALAWPAAPKNTKWMRARIQRACAWQDASSVRLCHGDRLLASSC
jgi:hypothetical protein